LGRFFATTVLASFVLNEISEMAQMSAYVETAGHSWTSTLGLCTRAAVGDVEIILGIYAAGALAAGDLGWGLRGRWNIYATAAVLGLAYAALAAGRWSYTERMPVVSVLGAGLWPLLQMTLLPPSRSCLPSGGLVAAQRKELYDESYRRMDEWLDGRRDVGLDGDRRAGGGPAGRPDYQAVQEIIVRSRPACEVNC
jgi:hypothetical protein